MIGNAIETGSIIDIAIEEFRHYTKHIDDEKHWGHKPKDIFETYHYHIKYLAQKRRQLKNPVAIRTGKPLKACTIKEYKSNVATTEPYVKGIKLAIKAMIRLGILGPKKRGEHFSLRNKVLSLEDYRWNKEYEALQQRKESGEFDIEGVLNDLLKE